MPITFLSLPVELRHNIYLYIYCNDEEELSKDFSCADMEDGMHWRVSNPVSRDPDPELFRLFLTYEGSLRMIANLDQDFAADIRMFVKAFELSDVLAAHDIRIIPLLERVAEEYQYRPLPDDQISSKFESMTTHINGLLEILSKGIKDTYSCIRPNTITVFELSIEVRINTDAAGNKRMRGKFNICGAMATWTGDTFSRDSSLMWELQSGTTLTWSIGIDVDTRNHGLMVMLDCGFRVHVS